jgi:hypothetical protein
MKPFETEFKMINKRDKKLPFASRKTSAITGWKVVERAGNYIYEKLRNIVSVEPDYWRE